MNDPYLVERPTEVRIESPTPAWRHASPVVAAEAVLIWCAFGWVGVGLWTGLAHPASPAGNAFVAAAQFTGSWVALTVMLAVAGTCSLLGLVVDSRGLRRLGLALAALNFAFIASGLSTNGFISTAVVVYPSLSLLAIATWFSVPKRP